MFLPEDFWQKNEGQKYGKSLVQRGARDNSLIARDLGASRPRECLRYLRFLLLKSFKNSLAHANGSTNPVRGLIWFVFQAACSDR
jgi:hypothetical protein